MEPRKINNLRNILNILFMFLALAEMVGVVAFPNGSIGMMASYYVALTAVVIKMIEVCFRMSRKDKNTRNKRYGI